MDGGCQPISRETAVRIAETDAKTSLLTITALDQPSWNFENIVIAHISLVPIFYTREESCFDSIKIFTAAMDGWSSN